VRVVTFAYACEPGHGSEPGAGWMWARLLSRLGDTWVLTRANNRPGIEAELQNLPDAERLRLHFVYVDLPPWARWWKRGKKGIHVYYLLWQVAALSRARRLHRQVGFDLSWHVTFSNVWLGTAAPLLGLPFVYGPVGGGAMTPPGLLPVLGVRGAAGDLLRSVAIAGGRYLNPLARLAWRRARLVLVQNRDTLRWLPSEYRSKANLFPHVVIDRFPEPQPHRPRNGGPTALFAGNLLPLKGVALAISALRFLPEWRLILVGAGPDRTRLERITRRLGLEDRVSFLGAVPRSEVLRLMSQEADVFLFPSLHDQAGWVVIESLCSGLPVVCIDAGGPPLLGGNAVPPSRPRQTAEALARAVEQSLGKRPSPPHQFGFEPTLDRLTRILADSGIIQPEPETADLAWGSPAVPTGIQAALGAP
jgi:glycosyltransferase involved in cell wall biosynthesis